MGWSFRHDDHVYREDDVTIGQWERICELAGDDKVDGQGKVSGRSPKPWPLVNPAFNPRDARSIFSVLVSDHTGETVDAAAKIVQAWTTKEFLGKFETDEEDDRPNMYEDGLPKAEAGGGTSGSSGVPSGTDGPPTS